MNEWLWLYSWLLSLSAEELAWLYAADLQRSLDECEFAEGFVEVEGNHITTHVKFKPFLDHVVLNWGLWEE